VRIETHARPLWEDPRWLRNTAIFTLIVAVATLGVSFLWPKSYKAVAKILPDPTAGSSSSLMGLAAASGFGDLISNALGSSENPSLIYPEILASRALLERVALTPYPAQSRTTIREALGIEGSDRFALDRAIRRLSEITSVQANLRSGFIYLTAVTADSVLSAAILQQMLTELDRFNMDSRASRGRATREFVEARMDEARRELATAEQSLAIFRRNNIRIGNSPDLLLGQARLEREVDTQTEVYRLLARQYEVARIEEKRDTPTFTVVDPPRPPVRKYRPQITLNVCIAAFLAMGLRVLGTQVRSRRGPALAVSPHAATLG
jgi:uncharacterized protein involved in exopolysaccharide biosynthesis